MKRPAFSAWKAQRRILLARQAGRSVLAGPKELQRELLFIEGAALGAVSSITPYDSQGTGRRYTVGEAERQMRVPICLHAAF